LIYAEEWQFVQNKNDLFEKVNNEVEGRVADIFFSEELNRPALNFSFSASCPFDEIKDNLNFDSSTKLDVLLLYPKFLFDEIVILL
jgi:hypothetical protein